MAKTPDIIPLSVCAGCPLMRALADRMPAPATGRPAATPRCHDGEHGKVGNHPTQAIERSVVAPRRLNREHGDADG